jgi:hypothetical protein
MAMTLHGLNDWDAINGHGTWVAVVAVSGILLVAYAKAGPAAVVIAQPVAAQGVAPQGVAPQGSALPTHGVFPAQAAPSPGAAPAAGRPWYVAQAGPPPAPPVPPVPPVQPAGSARGGPRQPAAASQTTVTVAPPRVPRPTASGKKPWWEE